MCRGTGTRGKSTTSPSGNSGMTAGSVLNAGRTRPLAADDLDGQVAVARPVELGRDDGLELPEHEPPLADGERQRVPEQAGLEVRVRVVTVAIRQRGVVVLPGVARAHHFFEHALHVVEQRRLPLVDE